MPVPARSDLLLGSVVAALGLVEVFFGEQHGERPLLTAAVVLLGAVALLLRSWSPLGSLAVLAVLVTTSQLPQTGLALTASLFVGCLLALGGVGRDCADRPSLVGVLSTVTLYVVGAAFAGRPWDVVVAGLACGAAWGAGRLLRREAQRAGRLAGLAADLVAERDASTLEAVHAERLRIARELHDAVAHTVSVMTLQVGGVRRQLDAEPARRRERDVLKDVEELGRAAVLELRRIVGVLRSDEDDDGAGSLSPQPRLADVEELVARVRGAGVDLTYEVVGSPRALPVGLEVAAYRIVQESLTNVLKHASGAAARVRVTYSQDAVTLAVADDGSRPRGRTRPRAEDRGHGLVGMRERVAVFGGSLDAGPRSAGGFTVRATLPVDVEDEGVQRHPRADAAQRSGL